jgi:hypothetical protein
LLFRCGGLVLRLCVGNFFGLFILIFGAVMLLESALAQSGIAVPVVGRSANGAINYIVIVKKICTAGRAFLTFCV